MDNNGDPRTHSDGLPELSVVQKWFYAVVTHPGGVEAGAAAPEALKLAPMTREGLEYMVTRSNRVSARDRMAIYANAYFARLIECLSDTFPILAGVLGEDVFNGFAFDYLQHYPSRCYTLAKLGEHFVSYLRESKPVTAADDRATPSPDWADFIIDLANLEWTIAEVFDGPGLEHEPRLSPELLSQVAPTRWPTMRLLTNPALRLLAFRFPVNAYYTQARRSREAVQIPQSVPSFAAISRRDYVVRRYELSRIEYEVLVALQQGETIGNAIERAADATELDDEALARELLGWFRDWSGYQFFAGIQTA